MSIRNHPSVGDQIFSPHGRVHGSVIDESKGTVTVQWLDSGEKDVLTYAQFALSFDWIASRWEMIY